MKTQRFSLEAIRAIAFGDPVRRSLPVGVFAASAASAAYLRQQDFLLDHLPRRMLGLASAAQVDVASRAGVHWRTMAVALIALMAVTVLLHFLRIFREPAHRGEARILQVLGVTGIANVAVLLWMPESWPFVLFHAGIMLFLLLGVMLKKVLLPPAIFPWIREGFYVPVMLISLALASLLMVLVGMLTGTNSIVWWISIPPVCLLAAMLLIKAWSHKSTAEAVRQKWNTLAWFAAPLVVLPALIRFADEIFFDLNKQGHYNIEVIHCLGILLAGLGLWMAVRTVMMVRRRKRLAANTNVLLSVAFYPRAILTMVVVPYLTQRLGANLNYFEDASVCLPVSEFHAFGRIPILEILPPHLLSDFIGGFIQSLLTGGPEGNDFMGVNNALYYGVSMAGVYITAKWLLRNAHLAFAFVALLPAAMEIIPSHFAIGGAGVSLLVYGLRQDAEWRRHFLMMGGFLAMMLWKLDVGYPAVLSAAAVWAMDRLTQRRLTLRWKPFLLACGIWVGLIAAIILLLLAMGASPIHNAGLALQYYMSEQSYGYDNLGDSSLMPYKLQYFLFFGAALAMLVWLLLRHKSDGGSMQWLMVAFLLLFYLFNYQRGMVRHSLREEWDDLVHSFFYAATAGFAMWMARRHSLAVRWAVFCGAGLLLALTTKYPNRDIIGAYASADFLRMHVEAYAPYRAEGVWISRTEVPAGVTAPSASPIVEFLRAELDKDQTFLDFSNQPLLYHYSHRQIPSYFAQIPAMLHNDVLQKDFLQGLGQYDLPLAIFTGTTEHPLTASMDDIQNRVRHYRIAEHIYTHYDPWGSVEGNFIWKRKGYQPKNTIPKEEQYNGSISYEDLWLGHISHLWAETDPEYAKLPAGQPLVLLNDSLHRSTQNVRYFRLPSPIDKSRSYYVQLKFQNDQPHEVMGRMILTDDTHGTDLGELIFTVPARGAPSSHALRVSCLMTWHYPGGSIIRVETPVKSPEGEVRLLEASLQPGD